MKVLTQVRRFLCQNQLRLAIKLRKLCQSTLCTLIIALGCGLSGTLNYENPRKHIYAPQRYEHL